MKHLLPDFVCRYDLEAGVTELISAYRRVPLTTTDGSVRLMHLRRLLAAGELDATAVQCRDLGAEVATVARRPNDEADCEAIMQAGVDRFGALDILVVGSGLNDVSPIVEMAPERFENVMQGATDEHARTSPGPPGVRPRRRPRHFR